MGVVARARAAPDPGAAGHGGFELDRGVGLAVDVVSYHLPVRDVRAHRPSHVRTRPATGAAAAKSDAGRQAPAAGGETVEPAGGEAAKQSCAAGGTGRQPGGQLPSGSHVARRPPSTFKHSHERCRRCARPTTRPQCGGSRTLYPPRSRSDSDTYVPAREGRGRGHESPTATVHGGVVWVAPYTTGAGVGRWELGGR